MRRREEVLQLIEGTLGRTAGVSGAAYFGSTATKQFDAFSDIDLVVGCTADAADQVVAGLHAALGIVLFRPFTEDRRPGGRYWFEDVNPFLRLDVSFYRKPVFDELLLKGGGFVQPPFERVPLHGGPAADSEPIFAAAWSELDFEFGGALRQFHESVKKGVRGARPKRSVTDAEAAVLTFRALDLSPGVWVLYEQSVESRGGST